MKGLPILLLDKFFLFPKYDKTLALTGSQKELKKIILHSLEFYDGKLIVIPNREEEELEVDDDYSRIGTLAQIKLKLASSASSLEDLVASLKEVNLLGLDRVVVKEIDEFGEFNQAKTVEVLETEELDAKEREELTKKLLGLLPDLFEKFKINPAESSKGGLPIIVMRGNAADLIDFVAHYAKEIDHATRWAVLASNDLEERLQFLCEAPEGQRIEDYLNLKTNDKIKKQQLEYYLRQKLEIIKKSLKIKEEGNKEAEKYLKRLEKKNYPKAVQKAVKEEISRLETTSNSAGENGMIKQYIEWVLGLPWVEKTSEEESLGLAAKRLDASHYGLVEIKERIIEYLAERKKSRNQLGQVICLVGPPGVGKTSLGKSIAEATGRNFVSVSLGGVNDVAEIKGHRRTYLGSIPGRIIQAMKRAGSKNPVILIDEIDKISVNFKGDPADALLDAFDPKQNQKFVDSYLGEEVPFDLSEVMFVCTANDISDLPSPLLDRMEIVELNSYTEREKLEIAKRYLIPEILKNSNLEANEVRFADSAILEIIKYYTKEAGVRNLNRELQKIIRKLLVKFLTRDEKIEIEITAKEVSEYLKKRRFFYTENREESRVGVVNGLAYTGYGGEILPLEVIKFPKKEGAFELTGNLGDIMKESALVALNYVKANHDKFGIDLKIFNDSTIHAHAPEGAVPKDGPSAGIALTSAIISSLTGQAVSNEIGMTGEITLHGQVEPIGGLKEKAMGAQRAGVKTIIIPQKNEKDIEEIPEEVRQELKIITVSNYSEVWDILFSKQVKAKIKKKTVSKSRSTKIRLGIEKNPPLPSEAIRPTVDNL